MTAWPTLNGAPGYAPVGGTSSAAPVVAGIAGLLFSANLALTNTQVEQALETSSAPVGFSVAYGRVDALAALESLGFNDPQPSSLPVNTSAPQLFVETNGPYAYQQLTGAPQVGQVLLRGQGGWTGSAPLSISAVQWQRCSSGSSCSTVANAATYTVQSADSGYSLRVVVTVKNGLGSTAVASPLSDPVGGTTTNPPPPPANSTPPSISGTAQDGQTLTASPGSWTGSPSSYGYQWQDCDTSGANCAAIAGAANSSYTAQSGDVGYTLRVAVTASNTAGATTASSPATSVVAAAPPPPPTTQTSTFSGSLNSRNPSRSFSVSVGAGVANAQLSFAKCSALSVGLSNGASASGPSVVSLNATLAAGSYTYTVGGGKCSFTLTVTSPSP
jgi:hypothetical protein